EIRRLSVHEALGGGAAADLLLWRNWRQTVIFLVGSTGFWFLFEIAGYNLLSFISNVLLLLVVILFFWTKSATLLNRPLPPLPNLEIAEETVVRAADEARLWMNKVLSIAHEIAICGNLILFTQVSICLWLASYIGSLFTFLSLTYISLLLSVSVPFVYEKYRNPIDRKLGDVCSVARTQYRKIDDDFLRKIPFPKRKGKKIE
ncbi:hypothetical protein M569_04390, partial [Genlisea aurea]